MNLRRFVVPVLLAGLGNVSAFSQHADQPPALVAPDETDPGPPGKIVATAGSGGAAFNVRLATDASPDLTDLDSFVYSTTSQWPTAREKVWALFYWSHILKRQTTPIVQHGLEVTDPIRNFTDYGFTMCSTTSGINQMLYEKLGLRHRSWDICNHTVSAVEYDGKFRMVDTSMSNLVTTDDGSSLASVTEAAADAARLVRERSLYATSANGFLSGSDALRNIPNGVNLDDGSVLKGYAANFCESSLKYRDYFYNWDAGHRYVLNLREDESYTRYYSRLGAGREYWAGSEKIASPDPANTFEIDSGNRFGNRGNGRWAFTPSLAPGDWDRATYAAVNTVNSGAGLQPATASAPADVIYKIQAANVITSQVVSADLLITNPLATTSVAISVNHGATWTTVAQVAGQSGAIPVQVNLRDEVNGAYETLVRFRLDSVAAEAADALTLTRVDINTVTQVNVHALPKLNIGRNEVFVGLGDQTDTMVLWPDLRGTRWQKDAFDSSNIASQSVAVPRKYTALVYPAVTSADAYLTYRMEAPRDLTRIVYGGRLYNTTAGSYIDFLHSLDEGATWIRSYRFSEVNKPYDVVHYETVTNIPAGVKSVRFKFLIHSTGTSTKASGLYAVRMEANHQPQTQLTAPVEVTLRWAEMQPDRTTVRRSHKELIDHFPAAYVVDVGGSDHPVMESMTLNVEGAGDGSPLGYSDSVDVGGSKFQHTIRTEGVNLAKNQPYTVSRAPSGFQNSPGASNTTMLTDGIVGAPGTGGIAYWWGQCWTSGSPVDLQVDLGTAQSTSAFRAHLFGYSGWDALKGQVQDRVEMLTSVDGTTFVSHGLMNMSLWRKDIPINYMLQDDGKATGWNFEHIIPSPVVARYVRYHVTPKRNLCVSEVQVFDRITYQAFADPVARPRWTDLEPAANTPPTVALTSPAAGTRGIAPATFRLAADAADADGTVIRVQFYADGTLAGEASAAPFAIEWTNVPPGRYTLTALAIDNAGATTTSSPVVVDVEPPVNGPVAINEIVLHAAAAPQITGGWTVTPDASAASGARLQNPNTNAPKVATPLAAPAQAFDLTFQAEAGKAYRLWLRGKALSNSYNNDSVYVQFDRSVDLSGAPIWRIGTADATTVVLEDCGGCGVQGWGWADNGYGTDVFGPLVYFETSGPQRVRIQMREDGLGIDQLVLSAVTYLKAAPGTLKNDATILERTLFDDGPIPSNAAPQVVLTSPLIGTPPLAPATLTLGATATDSDGTVAAVEFYAGTTLLATIDTAPFTAIWPDVAAGTYTLTARAIDDLGAATTSAPLIFAVAAPQPPSTGAIDEIVLYPAADAQVLGGWTVVTDNSAATGARLQNPNANAPKVSVPLAAPTQAFDVSFEAEAGKAYRLWIRGKASSDSYNNDSIFVQFDNSVDSSGAAIWRIGSSSATSIVLEECGGCGLKGWGWADNGYGQNVLGQVVYFAQSGPQRLRVQMREDGLGIDQIALSAVRYLTASPGTTKNDTVIIPR